MKKAMVLFVAAGLVLALCGLCVAAEETKELKGDAGCMKCCFNKGEECAPAVKIGDDVLALKASEKADEATKKLIESFKGATKATKVVIKGVVQEKTVVADEVKKVEEKKD